MLKPKQAHANRNRRDKYTSARWWSAACLCLQCCSCTGTNVQTPMTWFRLKPAPKVEACTFYPVKCNAVCRVDHPSFIQFQILFCPKRFLFLKCRNGSRMQLQWGRYLVHGKHKLKPVRRDSACNTYVHNQLWADKKELMRCRAANLGESPTIKCYNMHLWEYFKHSIPFDFMSLLNYTRWLCCSGSKPGTTAS